jgi:hypothetical protein
MTRGLGTRHTAMTPVDAGQGPGWVAALVQTGSTATAAAPTGAATPARTPLPNDTNHPTTSHATRMRTGS